MNISPDPRQAEEPPIRSEADPGAGRAVRSSASARRIAQVVLLAVFAALPLAGALLSFLQVSFDGVGGVEGLGGADSVAVSPDGRHVYVTGFDDDAIGVFVRDASRDTVSFASFVQDGLNGLFGLDGATGVAVSPDGKHVYATAQNDDSLVVFSRAATLDELAFVSIEQEGLAGVSGLAESSSVAVAPDGRLVLATGAFPGTLAVFTRSASLDDLSFVTSFADDVGNTTGIGGANAVAISADGVDVYVTGTDDNALAHFVRDGTSDDIAFVASYPSSASGDGLNLTFDVAVSPDSRHVYVTSLADSAISVFERDPSTPILNLVATYRDGVDGVDGLRLAAGVSVSARGGRVAVTSLGDDALAVFQRDGASGRLRQIDLFRNERQGVVGMNGPLSVADSPDNQNVFVASFLDSALVTFTSSLFQDSFESATTDSWSMVLPRR